MLQASASDFLGTRDAFAAFVEAWESGTLPRRAWTHAAHVAIGACYAVRFGDGAFERIRDGIRRYNTAVGIANTDTSGYHETLTRFWAGVIADEVRGCVDEWEAACRAVERYGEARDLHTRYYGFDVAGSVDARRAWMPPDLGRPLG